MQKSPRCAQKKKLDKIKVVLDTNVFVSAFLSPGGTAAQIVAFTWQGKFQACYNQAIFDEYVEVLSRDKFKFKIPQEDIQEITGTIKKDGLSFDIQPSSFPMLDETDRVFYDVAKCSGAFLITGNKKHYPDEPFIIPPRDFMNAAAKVLRR